MISDRRFFLIQIMSTAHFNILPGSYKQELIVISSVVLGKTPRGFFCLEKKAVW